MAGKGADRLAMEYEDLIGCEGPLPDVLNLRTFAMLLAGTGDQAKDDYRDWVRMLWRWIAPGERWEGDECPEKYQVHQVVLLFHHVDRAAAAKWLKSVGESKDTLSEPAKHWLGDHLHKSGNPRPHREKRLILLKDEVERLRAGDPSLDVEAMPGTRKDLLEHCQRVYPGNFQISEATFKGDLRGICSFRDRTRRSGYYCDLRKTSTVVT